MQFSAFDLEGPKSPDCLYHLLLQTVNWASVVHCIPSLSSLTRIFHGSEVGGREADHLLY